MKKIKFNIGKTNTRLTHVCEGNGNVVVSAGAKFAELKPNMLAYNAQADRLKLKPTTADHLPLKFELP